MLIVAGSNNLLFGETAVYIAAGIEAIASKLEATHPAAALFVLLPPPLGVGLRHGIEQKRVLQAMLAPRFEHRLIDADGALTAGGRESNPNYQDDLVHFTSDGYEVLTGIVRAAYR